jgi:hypothetical protein
VGNREMNNVEIVRIMCTYIKTYIDTNPAKAKQLIDLVLSGLDETTEIGRIKKLIAFAVHADIPFEKFINGK